MPEPATSPEPKDVKPEQAPVGATATTEPQTKPTAPELPKKDFFKGDNMRKWMEQSGMFRKESAAAPAPTTEKKPCPNCPPGETQKSAERKPLAVLNIDGKDVPVYDQKTLDSLAQRGTQTVKAESPELQEIQERERRLNDAYDALDKMRQAIDSGEVVIKKKGDNGSDQAEDIDYEAMDPATRKKFEDLQSKIKVLETETEYVRTRREAEQIEAASKALNDWYSEAVKETPLENRITDSGINLTEKALAGLLTVKASEDAVKMKAGKIKSLRPMQEYIREAVHDLSILQGGTAITAESVIKNHPKVAEEIGQQAIARYLKKQSGAAPNARSATGEIRTTPSSGRQFTSLDDALDQARKDGVAMAGLKRLVRNQS